MNQENPHFVASDGRSLSRQIWSAIQNQRIFGSALLGQFFASGSNFVVNILLAKELGPRLFGFWALALVVVSASAALHYVLVQIPVQVLSFREDGRVNHGFVSANTMVAVIYAALSGAAATIGGVLVCYFVEAPMWLGAGIGPFLFGLQLAEYNRRALLVTGQLRTATISEAVRAGLSVIALILCIRATDGLQLLGVTVWSLAILTTIVGLVGVWLILRLARPTRRTSRDAAARGWRYAKWMVPTALSSRMGPDATLVLSGMVLGPVAIGGFRAMLQIANVFNLLYNALVVALPVRYVAIRRTGGDAQLAKITRRLVLAFGIIGMAAIVAVGTLGEAIVRFLLGDAYLEYVPLLYWLTLMYVAILIHSPVSSWLHALGASSKFLLPNLAGMATALILLFPLIGLLGIAGLAASMLCLYAVEVAALASTLRRELRLSGSMEPPPTLSQVD